MISVNYKNARLMVRSNGKLFQLLVWPQFINSPLPTNKYLLYLEVIRSREDLPNPCAIG